MFSVPKFVFPKVKRNSYTTSPKYAPYTIYYSTTNVQP